MPKSTRAPAGGGVPLTFTSSLKSLKSPEPAASCVRSRRLFSAPSAPTLLLPLFDWSNRLRNDPAVTPVPSKVLAEYFEEFSLEELAGCNICRNSKPMGYSPLVPVELVPFCSLFWLARCWLASMLGSNADRSGVSSSSSEASVLNFRTAPSPRSLASAWPCWIHVAYVSLPRTGPMLHMSHTSHFALAPCYTCVTPLCPPPLGRAQTPSGGTWGGRRRH
mmetsp:Transcript_18940/g.31827  ORF Transcript_18940/g.31827 Transcript_18940/m.31827 type:complete len:220 (-) Transcript_18940:488-1147(-)